ncbi:MAG: hypothetical protein E6J03_04190 [Chloroflexi bacterium]|nr:MAG: hypothetical protein E6J03_04190 [Chloroflexota bacterium]
MDKRRSRPVRPAVRCALAGVMATVAVSSAWQVVSAKSTTAVASAARGHLKARHHHAVATEADNMKSVTLRRGDTLTVTLHGGWSTPTSSDQKVMRDSGMKPMFVCPPNAMCATPSPGPTSTTSATFIAGSQGTATVDASRAPSCPPGRMCPMYVQIYRLSVTVTP